MKTKITLFTIAFFLFAGLNNFVKAQWSQTGMTSGVVNCLATDGTNIYAGGTGVMKSSDNGATWTSSLTMYNVYSLLVKGSTLFAGTGNSGVWISNDSAATWTHSALSVYNIWSLAANGTDILAGTEGAGMYKSTDNGLTFSSTGLSGGYVRSITVNGSKIFAGMYGGGVRLSTDNAASFIAANAGMTTSSVFSLLTNGTRTFAGTASSDGGLWISNNDGSSWATSTGSTTIYALARSGNNIFAGTSSSGIRLSTDNGATWATGTAANAVNNGLTGYDFRSLLITGGYIYAGGYGDGVWKRPLSEMIVGIEEMNKDLDFVMYPNPGNGQFRIEAGSNIENASLEVYSLLGAKVLSVQNADLQNGMEIDLSAAPKGIYFVKVSDGTGMYSRKLIIQ
ncbi:MAG: glycoside hydrolase, family [Bacteroidetes bacterium]|nr:glycoside hydrolase, family [Bacteroidota bacterium]